MLLLIYLQKYLIIIEGYYFTQLYFKVFLHFLIITYQLNPYLKLFIHFPMKLKFHQFNPLSLNFLILINQMIYFNFKPIIIIN